MSNPTFTVSEFNQQVVEFRQLFGDKTFWKKPAAHRKVACDALGMAYFFLDSTTPKEEVNRCADMLMQTLNEYQQRELKLIQLGVINDVA